MARLTQVAQQEAERECCGLLAGHDGAITEVFPATSAAANPETEYEIAPKELFRFMREIRAAGLTMMGIYHSHPNSRNEPSIRDIERAYYPDAAYFIIAPRADARRCIRAFSIRESRVTELTIEIL